MPKPRGKLTTKQKMFIKAVVKNKGNGTQAAVEVYDVKNRNVARNIASTTLARPSVREELDRILKQDGLLITDITNNIKGIAVDKPRRGFSGADILDANKTLLKLHGVLTDRKQVTTYNINTNLSKLSKYELIELRKKKQQETDTILQGELVD